jgi:N5-(cytidine 5'-diphosphoramidyl)-L-glutamine hydrolase
MSSLTIVGVSQRVDRVNSHKEWRDALDERLIDWIIEAGFMPVPIPNNLIDLDLSTNNQTALDNWLKTLNIGAIVLSGGNNIGDIPQRDFTEQHLLFWAEKNRKPVLGICRGMQMMGVYFGGKLIGGDGHVRTRHQLQVTNNRYIFPKTVNSYHNQVLKKSPNTFQILAKSEDGSIEAMAHKVLPWEAWMWHPEREEKFNKIDQKRFKNLVDSEKT